MMIIPTPLDEKKELANASGDEVSSFCDDGFVNAWTTRSMNKLQDQECQVEIGDDDVEDGRGSVSEWPGIPIIGFGTDK
jgi:hypothetical protein